MSAALGGCAVTDELTKEAAIDLVRRHSYPYGEDDPSPCIHTRLGGIGADWSVAALVETIEFHSTSVEWGTSLLGHDLVVVRPGKTDLFVQVHAPAKSDDCARCSPSESRAQYGEAGQG